MVHLQLFARSHLQWLLERSLTATQLLCANPSFLLTLVVAAVVVVVVVVVVIMITYWEN